MDGDGDVNSKEPWKLPASFAIVSIHCYCDRCLFFQGYRTRASYFSPGSLVGWKDVEEWDGIGWDNWRRGRGGRGGEGEAVAGTAGVRWWRER